MKRRELNSLANSLCAYLCSRNHDIAGYWGIGMLCAASKRERRPKFGFQIRPGAMLRIFNYEISGSQTVTDKLVKFGLDSIEGRLSFFVDGRYPHGAEKYTCGIAIAITQGGRTGLSMRHVECWPHDPSRERRRTVEVAASVPLLERLKHVFSNSREAMASGKSTGGSATAKTPHLRLVLEIHCALDTPAEISGHGSVWLAAGEEYVGPTVDTLAEEGMIRIYGPAPLKLAEAFRDKLRAQLTEGGHTVAYETAADD